VSDKTFREFFEQYGTVVDSIVMLDRVSKTGRGFGFVTFEDENVAKELLCSGSNKGVPSPPEGHTSCKLMIHGRMCEIKVSEPKKVESQSNLSSQSSLTVPEQIQFQNGATPSDAAVHQAGYVYCPHPQMYPAPMQDDISSAYYPHYYYPTSTQVGYNNYYQYSEQGTAYYPQDTCYYYPPQYYYHQWDAFGSGSPNFDASNVGQNGDSRYFNQPNDATIPDPNPRNENQPNPP
jgi:RNA recognition motif-containing protein